MHAFHRSLRRQGRGELRGRDSGLTALAYRYQLVSRQAARFARERRHTSHGTERPGDVNRTGGTPRYYGLAGIPADWATAVAKRDEILDLADRLYKLRL
jgi:hypothetical protein